MRSKKECRQTDERAKRQHGSHVNASEHEPTEEGDMREIHAQPWAQSTPWLRGLPWST